jgi:hypothetical protein
MKHQCILIFCTFLGLSISAAAADFTFTGETANHRQYHTFVLPADATVAIIQTSECATPRLTFSTNESSVSFTIISAEENVWYEHYPLGAGEWLAGIHCEAPEPVGNYSLTLRSEEFSEVERDIEPNGILDPNGVPSPMMTVYNGDTVEGHLGFTRHQYGVDNDDRYIVGHLNSGNYSVKLEVDDSFYTCTGVDFGVTIKNDDIGFVFEDYKYANGVTYQFTVNTPGPYFFHVTTSAHTYSRNRCHGAYRLALRNLSYPYTEITAFQYPENSICGMREEFAIELENTGGTLDIGKLNFYISYGILIQYTDYISYSLPAGGKETYYFAWDLPRTLGTGQYTAYALVIPSEPFIFFIKHQPFGILCRRNSINHALMLLLLHDP